MKNKIIREINENLCKIARIINHYEINNYWEKEIAYYKKNVQELKKELSKICSGPMNVGDTYTAEYDDMLKWGWHWILGYCDNETVLYLIESIDR